MNSDFKPFGANPNPNLNNPIDDWIRGIETNPTGDQNNNEDPDKEKPYPESTNDDKNTGTNWQTQTTESNGDLNEEKFQENNDSNNNNQSEEVINEVSTKIPPPKIAKNGKGKAKAWKGGSSQELEENYNDVEAKGPPPKQVSISSTFYARVFGTQFLDRGRLYRKKLTSTSTNLSSKTAISNLSSKMAISTVKRGVKQGKTG